MSNVKQDLLIVTDATASMGRYLMALTESMSEILALSKITGAFDRIGVLAYRDYCDTHCGIFLWSEWNNPDLSKFTSNIRPDGGGDYPEAAKSGLLHALDKVDPTKRTLILWYADAPPHHIHSTAVNAKKERKQYPNDSTDWVKLSLLTKEKNCTVFSFGSVMGDDHLSYYVLLSQLTSGACLSFGGYHNIDTYHLSRLTLDIVIHWTGLSDESNTDAEPMEYGGVSVVSFKDPAPTECSIEKLGSEENGTPFLPAVSGPSFFSKPSSTALDLAKDIPTSPNAHIFQAQSIQKRFADPQNEDFRQMVYVELEQLIESNVFALTYNSVFGQLWRAVCKTGDSSKKADLANAFSVKVGQIDNEKKREVMQKWLEDSFDSRAEIEEIVKKAPVDEATVWVYLDLDSGVEFTRRELLEVSRSCNSGVLKKLATIFTHLKVIDPAVPLPADQRKLPTTLRPREFFRLLPHLVVPGTLFPHRAAALTAILALITGVPFLTSKATALLETTRGTWLNIEVPENISSECARFLLSAPEGVVLTPDEKEVYTAIRRYKLLELNLESRLKAMVGWTPDKSRNVGDWKVKCVECNVKRSVTIMSHEKKGVCGMCRMNVASVYPNETSEMDTCWVECSVKTCRAQYVLEDVGLLWARPKCHYCRNSIPCPSVECTRCTNRVIVPTLYRTPDLLASFLCPGCANASCKHETITETETTTKALVEDNGVDWLALPANPDLLKSKSTFKIVQAQGFDLFREIGKRVVENSKNVESVSLVLGGKKIHNARDVLAQIDKRIGSGEVELGACALCFDDVSRGKLIACCGRRGCKHRVDEGCLQTWYGANEPGKLLNLMQLMCPFCRRLPSHKILTRFNRRVAELSGLRDALMDPGWYHAWCVRCGFARRAYERVCCEGGRLPNVDSFVCEECQGVKTESQNADLKVMACPKCGVMVEKTGGCNHISCPCGEHFCFVCGKGAGEEEIYTHMSEEHGGIFDEEEVADWDDGYD